MYSLTLRWVACNFCILFTRRHQGQNKNMMSANHCSHKQDTVVAVHIRLVKCPDNFLKSLSGRKNGIHRVLFQSDQVFREN